MPTGCVSTQNPGTPRHGQRQSHLLMISLGWTELAERGMGLNPGDLSGSAGHESGCSIEATESFSMCGGQNLGGSASLPDTNRAHHGRSDWRWASQHRSVLSRQAFWWNLEEFCIDRSRGVIVSSPERRWLSLKPGRNAIDKYVLSTPFSTRHVRAGRLSCMTLNAAKNITRLVIVGPALPVAPALSLIVGGCANSRVSRDNWVLVPHTNSPAP
ncbi:hypothetical protein NUU61_000957 [Penicillium alfredii]|uniref:Uncharacterized protein n=1 Tax=Penicillium alfredii TaxID=1506179 RepID=A0A9W9KRJ3_9EURO|nr:uncharacterized protein NUU61_000957 [Penicillium alfredii]KAJ5115198.1 hypothetical protein NUU61_000957 [Penicillium alfredii]